MRVTLIDYTENSIQKMATIARISHQTDGNKEDNIKLMQNIIKWGHFSVLEHAYATFKISGISRTCSHQMVRHRHLSFVEKSLRYTEPDYCIIPNNLLESYKKEWAEIYSAMVSDYSALVCNGIKKEDARFILPLGTATELYVTANFRAWREFLQKRLIPEAQWEIRAVAKEIQKELISISDEFLWEV